MNLPCLYDLYQPERHCSGTSAGVRRTALAALGYKDEAAALAVCRKYGRRGRLPWCDPRYADTLGYLSPGDVLLVPISHCLLRGLIRSIFVYALTTPVSLVSKTDPVVFSTAQRDSVQVTFVYMQLSVQLGHTSRANQGSRRCLPFVIPLQPSP